MTKLSIEIHGTGIHNRGAELMAIAVAEKVAARYPDAQIIVPPEFGSARDLERYGFICTWEAAGRYGWVRTILNMIRWLPRPYVVNPAQTDVVLDASGFAFSDQWGGAPAKNLYRKMQRFYRRRQLLVLLPQALGSFDETSVALWCKRLFSRASLICARDSQSKRFAAPLAAESTLRQYPDFTIGIAPLLPADVELPPRFAAIVPNMRMLDKSHEGELYIRFLRRAADRIKDRGGNPIFVIHDAKEDRQVIQLMGEDYKDIRVLTHSDPRVLKGILGRADFVIGSRFHALVSSLSQGVPCIGAGWSHKYPELFADFQCPELLIADLEHLEALDHAIEALTTAQQRTQLSEKISTAATALKARVDVMWQEVFALVDRHTR